MRHQAPRSMLADQDLAMLSRKAVAAYVTLFWENRTRQPLVRSDSLAACTWCVQVLRSPKEAFAAAMQSWRERCKQYVCLQGDYVEK